MHKVIREDLEQIIARVDLSSLRGKGVLITGGAGMLAAYLVRLMDLLNEEYDYGIRLGLLVRSRERARARLGELLDHRGVTVLEQDVCVPIAADQRFDYIVHAAGAADPGSITRRPFEVIEANTVGTANVCRLAREQGGEILLLSTREIYGAVDTAAIRENMAGALDPLISRSCYPESKRCAEAMLLANYNEYGVPFKTARIAHAYGPGMAIDNDGRIMADLMGDMVHHRDLVLKSTGQMKRSFCYISDAVTALLQVMLRGKAGEAYNVSNEREEITVAELARLMAAQAGTEVVFRLQDAAANSRGYLQIPRVRLDTAKLEALGWEPRVPLTEGIRRTYRFFTES